LDQQEHEMTDKASDRQEGGDHYMVMGVQPWTAMQAWMTPEAFSGFLRGNVIKYVARAGSKGDARADLLKARHYLDKLLEQTPERKHVVIKPRETGTGCTHDCDQGRRCTCAVV
jgi:hypothetical protein